MTDTIFALATAPGRGAVAVIRLSGPQAGEALAALAGRLPKPRRAVVRTLYDRESAVLDEALVLWFPAPRSYTGEDCAELQVHGGAAVIDAVMGALLAQGVRPAEPGEFTRRAFENGKLDLAQAEAVADLIDAETRQQARQAVDQLAGALGRRHQAWRTGLVGILGQLEAVVDFPDEELPADALEAVRGSLADLAAELDRALKDAGRGRRVREGYRIAVVGAPNAGKSSLFNFVSGHEGAIVTNVPGTTRDVIEAGLVLAGYKVLLADTAGLRETRDPIEAEGVRRARAWAESADLRLWVVDRSSSDGSWREGADDLSDDDFALFNKSDLAAGSDAGAALAFAKSKGLKVKSVAVSRGDVGDLLADLSDRVMQDSAGAEFPATTRARHEAQLRSAQESLERATAHLRDPELAAEDVRLAARALERIAGRLGVEDVLDDLFTRFCIGK